jgi:hypothetical protein
MGEDIALFDAVFFNLAADVASVSLGAWEEACSTTLIFAKLTALPRDLIPRLDCCLSLSTKLLKTASPLLPILESTD